MKAMRVLVDARAAARGLGTATVVSQLFNELERQPGIAAERWQAAAGQRPWLGTFRRSGLFDLSPSLDWRTRGADVYHYLSNTVSVLPPGASVVTVHDLFQVASHRRRDRVMAALLLRGLSRCSVAVCVSGRTRDELLATDPALRDRVEVVPWGRRDYDIWRGERSHVVAFAGRASRKRSSLIPEIWERYLARAANPPGLIVYARAGLEAATERRLLALGADVHFDASALGVADGLRYAQALLLTSRQEGYGLPVVEAGEVGTPVVIGDDADIAEEVVGAHCVRAATASPNGWVAALVQACSMGPVDRPLKVPTWTEVGDAYADVYRRAASR